MQEPNEFSQQSPARSPRGKRLGGYLVEAGLLTPAQIDVALNDQKISGLRFGEVLAARGWVKQQTIEYLMQKVILPEQEALGYPTDADESGVGEDYLVMPWDTPLNESDNLRMDETGGEPIQSPDSTDE